MTSTNTIGYKDIPILDLEQDSLDVRQYIESLSEFILECDTPMTIAIQGDWGSGKTSMMNMIKKNIDKQTLTIWFNTWQYSQFEMQSHLVLNMLSNFLQALGTDEGFMKNLWSTLGKGVVGAIKGSTIIATERMLGETIAGNLNEKLSESTSNIFTELTELRSKIEFAVNNKLKSSDLDRVVVFIDDLDRLMPEKAVELLEALKVFMDIDNCVFVLAVDYGVVVKGLEKKFGEKISNSKGKSFFDKIIQLPFGVPVGQYKVENYIQVFLEKMNVSFSAGDIFKYKELIETSIGFNPRSVKRLFNSYLLLNKVAEKKNIFSDSDISRSDKQRVLFAVICMQMAFDSVYDFLLKNIQNINQEFLLKLTDEELLKEDLQFSPLEIDTDNNGAGIIKFINFMEAFIDSLQIDNDNTLSNSEMNNLLQIISFSSITATLQEGSKNVNSDKWKKTTFSNYDEFLKQLQENGYSSEILDLYTKTYNFILKEFGSKLDTSLTPSGISFKNSEAKGRDKVFANLACQKRECRLYYKNIPKSSDSSDSIIKTYNDKFAYFAIQNDEIFEENKDQISSILNQSYLTLL